MLFAGYGLRGHGLICQEASALSPHPPFPPALPRNYFDALPNTETVARAAHSFTEDGATCQEAVKMSIVVGGPAGLPGQVCVSCSAREKSLCNHCEILQPALKEGWRIYSSTTCLYCIYAENKGVRKLCYMLMIGSQFRPMFCGKSYHLCPVHRGKCIENYTGEE